MNRKLLLICTAIICCAGLSAKEDHARLWQRANDLYNQKNYDSAVVYYNMIAAQKPANADVYYNLGNTYYRLNNIGAAVLNYERALKVEPSHREAKDNLYLTESRINNRIPDIPEIFFVRWWKAITRGTLANTYAVIAALLFVGLTVFFALRRLGKVNYAPPVQLSAAVILLCAVFLALSMVSAQRMVAEDKAVVMQEGWPLMAQPKYGKSQSQLPEGTRLEICSEKGAWYEVTLPDGRTGWVERSAVTKI